MGLNTLRFLDPNIANSVQRNTALGQNAVWAGMNKNVDHTINSTDRYKGSDNTGIGFGALSKNNGNDDSPQEHLDSILPTDNIDFDDNNFGSNNNTFGTGNTALGSMALAYNASGSYNTAVGRGALANAVNDDTNIHANTAVGFHAMSKIAVPTIDGLALNSNTDLHNLFGLGGSNVAVGAFALNKVGNATANVAIGPLALVNYVGKSANTMSTTQGVAQVAQPERDYGNIAVGAKSLGSLRDGGRNIAIGVEALSGTQVSSDNIAIGNMALQNYTAASLNDEGNNIVIGNQAASNLESGSNNIIIGSNNYNPKRNEDEYETQLHNKLLIGSADETLIQGNLTAEERVHEESLFPRKRVTIKGDLVVEGDVIVQGDTGEDLFRIIGHKAGSESESTISYIDLWMKGNGSIDGSLRVDPHKDDGNKWGFKMLHEGISSSGQIHAWRGMQIGRKTNPYVEGDLNIETGNITVSGNVDGIDINTKIDEINNTFNAHKHYYRWTHCRYGGCNSYTGKPNEELSDTYEDDSNETRSNDSSDIRLKENISDNHAGLKEITQLEVKNYTYKRDKNKIPHVGVIAQSLQKVFPNAVTEDSEGYLMIRWEDMFYAMINSIKELFAQFQDLTAKVVGLDKRIEQLETENTLLREQIEAQNKVFEAEIEAQSKTIEKLNKTFEERLLKLEKKQAKKDKKEKKE